MANPDYRALADKAQAEADAAQLDNVRDRCLRSAAAFLAMAQRQDLGDRNRARREAELAAAAADTDSATPDIPA
ncbi:hypothetical protein [Sphingobium abikonense]|uniref:hypothetical protein n=1 Tax=Sphingobium abikonense TaxID=86193 RepID=UPI000786FEA2|nr:hypothetical protein [Sphingobium abikonense]